MTRYAICTYGLYLCVSAFLVEYNIDGEGLVMLTTMMFFDTVTGALKARFVKLPDGQEFDTGRLSVGIIAKVLRLFCMLLFARLAGWMTDSPEIEKISIDTVLGLLITAEFISFLQNSIMLHKRKYIPEWDAVTYVMSWLLNAMKKMVEIKIPEQK